MDVCVCVCVLCVLVMMVTMVVTTLYTQARCSQHVSQEVNTLPVIAAFSQPLLCPRFRPHLPLALHDTLRSLGWHPCPVPVTLPHAIRSAAVTIPRLDYTRIACCLLEEALLFLSTRTKPRSPPRPRPPTHLPAMVESCSSSSTWSPLCCCLWVGGKGQGVKTHRRAEHSHLRLSRGQCSLQRLLAAIGDLSGQGRIGQSGLASKPH